MQPTIENEGLLDVVEHMSDHEFLAINDSVDFEEMRAEIARNTLELLSKVNNLTESADLVEMLKDDVAFTTYFGEDETTWDAGLEAFSGRTSEKKPVLFSLAALWRPLAIVFFNRRAVKLAKKLYVLNKPGNTNDYTKFPASKLPSKKTTYQILTNLEEIFEVIDNIARSPKTADLTKLKAILIKVGLDVGDYPYLTASWTVKGNNVIGGVIGVAVASKMRKKTPRGLISTVAKITGMGPRLQAGLVVTVGFLVGRFLATEIDKATPSIQLRGWTTNNDLKVAIERMLHILTNLYQLKEHGGSLEYIDISKLSPSDAARFNEVNFVLRKTIPTVRAIVSEISAGLSQPIHITHNDISDAVIKSIEAKHKLKS